MLLIYAPGSTQRSVLKVRLNWEICSIHFESSRGEQTAHSLHGSQDSSQQEVWKNGVQSDSFIHHMFGPKSFTDCRAEETTGERRSTSTKDRNVAKHLVQRSKRLHFHLDVNMSTTEPSAALLDGGKRSDKTEKWLHLFEVFSKDCWCFHGVVSS